MVSVGCDRQHSAQCWPVMFISCRQPRSCLHTCLAAAHKVCKQWTAGEVLIARRRADFATNATQHTAPPEHDGLSSVFASAVSRD